MDQSIKYNYILIYIKSVTIVMTEEMTAIVYRID